MTGDNLLGVPETLLPSETGLTEDLSRAAQSGVSLANVVAAHPTSSRAWALLADEAFAKNEVLESYAYARVGYHRGLDALRKAGWRGQGPVPWAHEPNRGVLRALYALMRAAQVIGESDEVERLEAFLRDADPAAIARIEAEPSEATDPGTDVATDPGTDPNPPTEAFFIRGED